MKVLSTDSILQALCRATGKFGLHIVINTDDAFEEVYKAAPYLGTLSLPADPACVQIYTDGFGWLLFDTKEEMERHFDLTVGDDGPTKLNPYDGPAKVYALTCDNLGVFLNENT